jgi:hypothetical protein
MKKVLLTALAALSIGSAAMAQKIDNSGEFKHHAEGVRVNPFKSQKPMKKGGEPVSAWYSTMEMMEESSVGSGIQGYVDFIVHDSLNKFVEEDGTIRYGGATSVGHVFDPKDDLIANTENPENQLSRFNSYKLDSIAFRYLYVRNVDKIPDGMGGEMPVVDTVFITYWRGNQIRRGSLQNQSGQTVGIFASPTGAWNFGKRMPSGYIAIDTILISSGANGIIDTTRVNNNNGGFENSWPNKVASFKAPDGININANGTSQDLMVGFAFTFKPGIPAVVGSDTAVFVYQLDPATAPTNMRRTNYFGYGLFLNEGAISWESSFYNTPLLALKGPSYATVNGWSGYIPGQAFNTQRFAETYFHISVDTSNGKPGVGLNDMETVKINSVFPNPATSKVTVNMNLVNSADVTVSLTNLMGQEVSTLTFPNAPAGAFELPMNTSNVNAGVYMINIKAGNYTASQKLVITK